MRPDYAARLPPRASNYQPTSYGALPSPCQCILGSYSTRFLLVQVLHEIEPSDPPRVLCREMLSFLGHLLRSSVTNLIAVLRETVTTYRLHSET